MANRDYDDRDRDRGGRGGFDRDDREGYGRDYGQGSRFDERGGFDRRDQWVGSGGNYGGGTSGGGFSRGGMSPGGGAYGRGDRDQDRSRGDMGSVNFGGGRGYDNFGGGAFRAGAEYAAREDERLSRDQGGDQGGDRGGYGRGEDERLGRPRGAQGGAFGSGGERDYGDYRTDRDRSLLGEIGSMLGFGSGRRDEDRGSRQDYRQDYRQGYRQDRGQDRGQGWGQGFREAAPSFGAERRGMGPRNYVRSDARVEEEVNERLSQGHLDATDVEVKVEGGEVTLSGTVRSRQDKRLAEDLADDVGGVRHVQNNLRVQDNWTAGGSAPGFGGGAGSRGAGGSMGASSGGPIVGDVGSATNVVTGQDPSQMAGQAPGQASAGSGNAGHSGQPGAADEPGKL